MIGRAACVTALVAALAPTAWSQNEWTATIVGPGFADVSVRELAMSRRALAFYRSEASSDTAFVLRFGAPEEGYPLIDAPDWFEGGGALPDFNLLQFPVLEAGDRRLRVRTADGPYWVDRSGAVAYLPWETFLVERVTGLDRLDPNANPLRASPDSTAEALPFTPPSEDGWECLAIREVRGVWARVEWSALCVGDEEMPPLDGWIRWREGDRLLIDYGLVC